MPYTSVADLPKAQTDQYTPHQKEAFLKAFNSAFNEHGGDEHRAFAVAHSAAKKTGSGNESDTETLKHAIKACLPGSTRKRQPIQDGDGRLRRRPTTRTDDARMSGRENTLKALRVEPFGGLFVV